MNLNNEATLSQSVNLINLNNEDTISQSFNLINLNNKALISLSVNLINLNNEATISLYVMKSDCTMILDFGSLKLMIFTNIVNDNDRLVGFKCLWPRKRTNNIINNK